MPGKCRYTAGPLTPQAAPRSSNRTEVKPWSANSRAAASSRDCRRSALAAARAVCSEVMASWRCRWDELEAVSVGARRSGGGQRAPGVSTITPLFQLITIYSDGTRHEHHPAFRRSGRTRTRRGLPGPGRHRPGARRRGGGTGLRQPGCPS
ncbi:hypothetical protein ACFFX0_24890 [Citricoccus parietis]|uniref:Uncharacterized protein n=1 Tax=Citricoccus parietis TaxID=592307 RepID=A0ABV5G5T9_9MICC